MKEKIAAIVPILNSEPDATYIEPNATYYEILGISKEADYKAIREALRQKLVRWHPDKGEQRGKDYDKRLAVSAVLGGIKIILLDPAQRKQYDIELEPHAPQPHMPPAAAPQPAARTEVTEVFVLKQAVEEGDVRTVEAAFSDPARYDRAKAAMNIPLLPPHGGTLLHLAAASGRAEILKIFVSYDGDLSSRNSAGFTVMQVAVRFGYEPLVEMLLKNGANPEELEDPRLVEGRNADGARAALAAGQRVLDSIQNLCAAAGRGQSLQEMLKKPEYQEVMDVRDPKFGGAPLHHAVANDRAKAFEELIDAGADLTVLNKDGFTPMQVAARFGNTAMVVKCIENDADPKELDDPRLIQGRNPAGAKVAIASGRTVAALRKDILRSVAKNQHVQMPPDGRGVRRAVRGR